MAVPPDERRVVEAERRVLQALCQEKPEGSLLGTTKSLLAEYRWRDPAHQVIFDCVTHYPEHAALVLRDHLAGCVTRKGFPDLNWEQFFEPVYLSKAEAEALVRELRASE